MAPHYDAGLRVPRWAKVRSLYPAYLSWSLLCSVGYLRTWLPALTGLTHYVFDGNPLHMYCYLGVQRKTVSKKNVWCAVTLKAAASSILTHQGLDAQELHPYPMWYSRDLLYRRFHNLLVVSFCHLSMTAFASRFH